MTTLQAAGVAGMFYPDDADALAAGVDASLARAAPSHLDAKAVIAPHAGHVYSGDIAGAAYSLLSRRREQLKRIILLGPTHRMPVRGMALSPADAWTTPLGHVRVDTASRDALARQDGVTVAAEPFAGEHSLEVHLPFIQRAFGDVEVLPILVGHPAPGQVSAALDQLWGGPETAIVISSDLSHFHDYDTARAKDEETAAGIERLNFGVCSGDRACGFFGVAGLIEQAQKRDLRVTALDVRNSGDTQGARDRVVGYGSFAFEYAHAARIDEGSRRLLIDLTRQVLRQAVSDDGKPPKLNINGALPRALSAQRATFVTLEIGGVLRGCTGSILPARSLLVDVADNAWRSGFGDRRFPPLTAEELSQLSIHVSVLSTPRLIPAASENELLGALRPDTDGLIIRDGAHQALFLPSVWAQLPEPQAFLRQLKMKAGLAPHHWSPTFQAFRFVTESFGEDAPALA
jgi:AmmeMemoRadiSam system protein B/AmmeMemoRadiSam system protein A